MDDYHLILIKSHLAIYFSVAKIFFLIRPNLNDMEIKLSALLFDGFCPESALVGKVVNMRLNKHDFFESEETGLQIYLIYGYVAVILHERGKGDFINTRIYATETINSEILAHQNKPNIPFVDDIVYFKNEEDISKYIHNIAK
jgi:hypothetical protein